LQVRQKLGYCPQFDALIEQMTVTETLRMYGRLRGIDEKSLPNVVTTLIKNLLLTEHAEKQAGTLR
jgi:ATP-binding cassette subfamily A (ABC1) protein 3